MSAEKRSNLNILTALHSEAKPLIDRFKLVRAPVTGVQFYRSEQSEMQINLVVTGLGRVAMATGVGWLAARTSGHAAWLNIGTAGHASHPLATAIRVAYCAGEQEQRGHHVPLVADWPGMVGRLQTGDHVCTDYPQDALADMEGSAFFSSAIRFAPAELVQSVKIVSDNVETGVEQLDGTKITEYIAKNADQLSEFAMSLVHLADRLPSYAAQKEAVSSLFSQLRLTHSQSMKLQDLALKQLNCGGNLEALGREVASAENVHSLLKSWQRALSENPPLLRDHFD